MSKTNKKGQLGVGILMAIIALVIAIVFLTAVIPVMADNTNDSVGSISAYDSTAGSLLSSIGFLLLALLPIGLLIGGVVLMFKGAGRKK